MFKITFEAKNMKDLQTQVNSLCETADALLNENRNQQVHIAPVGITPEQVEQSNNRQNRIKPTPVAPVPAPIDQQPVSTPLPVPAAQVVSQESAPIIPDLPWDARIHSASKTKVASGAWKKRRNLSDEVYKSVMAELEGGPAPLTVVAPTTPPPAPTAPAVVVPLITEAPVITPTAPPAQPVMTPVAQPPASPVPPTPVYTPAPVPQSDKQSHNFETFKTNFAQVMAGLKGQGHLTTEYIASLNAHFKVGELWELASDDSKLAELFQNFADFGWVTKVD